MQVKRFLFSFGFVLLFLGAKSQTNSFQWTLKYNPTDMLPFKMPRISGGIECTWRQHSLSAEYGV